MLTGWFTRVALSLAVLGIVVFDGGAVLVGRVSSEDKANDAAFAAAASYQQTKNLPSALAAAQAMADKNVVEPASLHIAADGSVTLSVHRVVSTIVLRRIHPLAHWAEINEPGKAPAPAH